MMLPPEGAMLLSIADRNKAEVLPIIRNLASLPYQLFATEGTAAMIRALHLPVTTVAKVGEGHPNVVEVIQNGKVNAVLNTMTGRRTPLRDGSEIRRAAAEKRIPCFTSLDTAKAAVETLLRGPQNYSIRTMAEYLAG
jgi:carbamoyl-phosphate synthase large subunit